MRTLRVVGLGEDGTTVILEDPIRGERFQLPADERLRAAARGDVTRLGQIEIELESQMRPREIQARIRAGESVEQVTAASGLPADKVDRFAYPVLLERSRTADLAQRAHPVREDGPDVQTLGEIVAHSFGLRGQEYTEASWDSWKGEDGKWVVQLRWTAGRSDNHAHWSFHPGAHGGTVTPLDDHAHDLLDPNPSRSLRTVRPVTELARQALAVDAARLAETSRPVEAGPVVPRQAEARPVERPVESRQVESRQVESRQVEARPVEARPAEARPVEARPVDARPADARPVEARTVEASRPVEPTQVEPPRPAEPPRPVAEQARPEPAAAEVYAQPEPTAPEPAAVAEPPAVEPEPAPTPEPASAPEPAAAVTEPVPEQPAAAPEAEEPKPEKPTPPRRGKGKKNHPIVPSWEDVLLGVRSNRG